MVYFMSTKTLVKEFEKDYGPDSILGCNLILFSNRIIPASKKSPSYEKIKSINYNNEYFFGLVSDETIDDKMRNTSLIHKMLWGPERRAIPIINNMIRDQIAFPDEIVIILTSEDEYKTKFIHYLAKAIEEIYEYPIINYKKDKHKDFTYKPNKVFKRMEKVRRHYYKLLLKDGEFDYTHMKKDVKMKILSDVGLYEKGMSEDEMNECFMQQASLPF